MSPIAGEGGRERLGREARGGRWLARGPNPGGRGPAGVSFGWSLGPPGLVVFTRVTLSVPRFEDWASSQQT